MDHKGVTIIDGLMGILIISVVSAGTVTIIRNSMRSSKAIETIQNATESASEIKEHMWSGSICSGNLKGKVVALGTEINLSKLRAYDGAQNDLGTDLITSGIGTTTKSAVVLEHIGIVPITRISPEAYLASVNVIFENRLEAAGAQAFQRSFPISVRVDPGTSQIVSCGAVGVDSTPPQAVCMSSGGNWDPDTNSCTRKACTRNATGVAEVRCATGAVGSDDVDCNTDIVGYPGADQCDWFVEAGTSQHDKCGETDDPIQKALRRYGPDGTLIASAPPPYIIEKSNINGGKAKCTWATDLGVLPAKWRCGVWCWRRR